MSGLRVVRPGIRPLGRQGAERQRDQVADPQAGGSACVAGGAVKGFGTALTLEAVSDIDGDGAHASEVLFPPLTDQLGAITVAAPAANSGTAAVAPWNTQQRWNLKTAAIDGNVF